MPDNLLPLQSLEDCIKRRNLILVHVGHSWFIIRATGRQSAIGGAIPLPLLNKLLPESAMINTISKIDDINTLQKYMEAGNVNKDRLLEHLSRPLDESGYEVVITIRGWGV